jgi:hypothetical protein
MSKKQYSTRLPPDKAEELEQYCDETGVSKSEVLRRSIETHLEADNTETANRRAWYLVNGVGISAILVSQISLFQSQPIASTLISASIYVSLLVYSYLN